MLNTASETPHAEQHCIGMVEKGNSYQDDDLWIFAKIKTKIDIIS